MSRATPREVAALEVAAHLPEKLRRRAPVVELVGRLETLAVAEGRESILSALVALMRWSRRDGGGVDAAAGESEGRPAARRRASVCSSVSSSAPSRCADCCGSRSGRWSRAPTRSTSSARSARAPTAASSPSSASGSWRSCSRRPPTSATSPTCCAASTAARTRSRGSRGCRCRSSSGSPRRSPIRAVRTAGRERAPVWPTASGCCTPGSRPRDWRRSCGRAAAAGGSRPPRSTACCVSASGCSTPGRPARRRPTSPRRRRRGARWPRPAAPKRPWWGAASKRKGSRSTSSTGSTRSIARCRGSSRSSRSSRRRRASGGPRRCSGCSPAWRARRSPIAASPRW